MSKRARNKPPKAKPFADADKHINAMELAYCYRTVTHDLTMDDVVNTLWAPEVVHALKAAFPYTYKGDHSGFTGRIRALPMSEELLIRLDLPTYGMLCPEPGIQSTYLYDSPLVVLLREVYEVHERFNKVRRVMEWLTDHATPNAAKYYFPTLGALLPEDHVFHRAKGDIPTSAVTRVAPVQDIRDSIGIVTEGLLAVSMQGDTPQRSMMQVGRVNQYGQLVSQWFGLI